MAYINSLEGLKDYCLRQLGHPVINIEISDDQLSDAINNATQKFIKEHFDGSDNGIVFLDIIKGQSEYILDENIISVKDIFVNNESFTGDDEKWMLTDFFSAYNNADLNSGPFSIVDIEIWRQNIREWNIYFDKTISFNYNQTTQKLTFPVIPTNTTKYALDVFIAEPKANRESFYDNDWFKNYCVALCGIQWSVNISKYDNVVLPGGAQFNHSQIESRYNDMKMNLDQELEEKYSEPIDPFFG